MFFMREEFETADERGWTRICSILIEIAAPSHTPRGTTPVASSKFYRIVWVGDMTSRMGDLL
jgi:hypothetical protein